MSEPQKPDRSNRIILIGLIVLAIVTIGGTIISTMGEWEVREAEVTEENQAVE